MHIVEAFSLNTGLKIDKPYIYERYTPLPFQEDYVTFQPFGKYDCRKYDYWEEVMAILEPELSKKNIKIVQLGASEEPRIRGAVDLRGQTDYNQVAYLIKNSLLHFGVDTFSTHMASGYNKKIVSLYSNLYPSNCGPYWSKESEFITLEPPRTEEEGPCYCVYENPKQINRIYPEKISESIFKLLNIKNKYPYKTLFLGQEYPRKRIEVVPFDYVTNWDKLGVDSLIVRMDEHFNEQALQMQLNLCKCSIVTNKPINVAILQAFKENIVELIILVEDESCLEYINKLRKAKISFALVSYLENEKLNNLKLKLVDYGQVIEKKTGTKALVEEFLKDKDLSNIYYKNATSSVMRENIYASRCSSEENKPISSARSPLPQRVIDTPDFWKDVESMTLLEKIA